MRSLLFVFCSFGGTLCILGGPIATLSPTSLNFGNQQLGTSSAGQTVTVTNTGDSPLSITSIQITGSNVADFTQIQPRTCKSSLAAGASCILTVAFTPKQTGTRSKILDVYDNAPGSPQTVSLTGVGLAPTATLSANALTFGGIPVGVSSGAQSITLTNTGTADLTISDITASGDFSQTNTCGVSVAVGSSCSISVIFTPRAIWSRNGTVVITDNAFNNPHQTILLAGMGNSEAQVVFSPTLLSFGNQNLGTTAGAKAITLTNAGTGALTLNSILTSGDYSQTNTCGGTLAAGASCTISVTFTPSRVGIRSGFLTANDNDPSFLQTVNLTGAGTVQSTTVAVTRQAASITVGQTDQFTATISGVPSSNVRWSVDGVLGGNGTRGRISTSGLYTAPSAQGTHLIGATSIADPAQSASVPVVVTNYSGVFTYKNDNLHTGQNLNEIALATSNVNANQFGKLFSYAVDGYVFAQPLYVKGVNIPSQGIHNVVYVATEADSVFAFDADNLVSQPLWRTNFTDPANGITTVPAQEAQPSPQTNHDIPIQVGITATPVIDPALNTLFVLVRTKEVINGVATYPQRLHALDIATGAEMPGSPVTIEATVNGSGVSGDGSHVSFDPLHENARPGLLLVNGVVYLAWSGLEDIQPWHGWVMGYSETSLQQVGVLNITPNGSAGGIWGGGGGITADANGNIFVTTGNGPLDANTGGLDYGDSVIKLTPTSGTLSVADYFSPFNQAFLANVDWDLGAGGMMLLPDQPGPFRHLGLVGGKGSTIYEINRDNLGQFSPTANLNVLTVTGAIGSVSPIAGNRAGGPGYWRGQVYYAGSTSVPMQFSLINGLISTVPVAQRSTVFGYPGGSPVISARGGLNGIVWILQTNQYGTGGAAVLHAYDAANISRELFNTNQLTSRNAAGPAVKFAVPTVANGKVYVGTQTELDVYGLLP